MAAAADGRDADRERLAAALREARRERGMTLTALAREIGYSVSHLSRLERGQRSSPSTDLLERLADALGLQPAPVFAAAGLLPPKVAVELAGPSFALAFAE